MKMFCVFIKLVTNYKKGVVLLLPMFLLSCASHSIQTGKNATTIALTETIDTTKISHTFF